SAERENGNSSNTIDLHARRRAKAARTIKRPARPILSRTMSVRGGAYAGSNGATHAGAAQTAIAGRILGEGLLVVVLGEVERRCIEDLGRDRVEALGLQRLLIHSLRRFGGLPLGGVEHVDAGAVLRADIVALPHALGRVVAFPEGLEQRLVGNLLGVIDD